MTTLIEQVSKADQLLADTGPQGKALLAAIERTGVSLRSVKNCDGYLAAYNPVGNEFWLPEPAEGAQPPSLHEVFNLRVHEGIHACQFAAAPAYRQAVCNMFKLEKAEQGLAVPAPEAMLAATDVMEAKAYTGQAYFNLLAARRCKDDRFISCMNNPQIPPDFIRMQAVALATGRDAGDMAREMTLSFLDMPYRDGRSVQDSLHTLKLCAYTDFALDTPGPALARARIYDHNLLEFNRIATAGISFGCEDRLVARYSRPALTMANARRLGEIYDLLPKRQTGASKIA